MEDVIIGTLFAFGAIIASFIGVVVARINTGQSFITGHSRCDVCNKVLKPHLLIPILSYFLSSGRAVCCGARLSPLAPISEALLGTLFVLAYLILGVSSVLVTMLVSLSLILALVLYDITHQILPPELLWLFVGASVVTAFLATSSGEILRVFIIAIGISTSLAMIYFLSRGRAMGLADTPFAFGLALLVGQIAITGFVFSFWIGAVIGIVLLAHRPSGSRMGVEVPFAPFLAAGFLLAYFTQWNLFAITSLIH